MFSQGKNLVFAKVATRFLILLINICFFISGCASSNVSRFAAANVDLGIDNAKNLVGFAADSNLGDTYDNLSQTTKGALIGGTAGAIAGGMTSGVGVVAGTAVGAIFGASYGAYIESNINLVDRLTNRGVNIIVLGDQILIVLPSTRIFQPATSVIRPEAYSTLEMVTEYINRYHKMLVKIAGYTNDTGSERVDISLSNQQAQSVAKFFIADGMDARLIYAVGYGGTRLVSRNTCDWEGSDNYRIEITLEKLYV